MFEFIFGAIVGVIATAVIFMNKYKINIVDELELPFPEDAIDIAMDIVNPEQDITVTREGLMNMTKQELDEYAEIYDIEIDRRLKKETIVTTILEKLKDK